MPNRGLFRKNRVLCVDAGSEFSTKAIAALESSGYQVDIANILDAFRMIYQRQLDVIVISGVGLHDSVPVSYTDIRQATLIPIIVVGQPDETAEYLESGADGFIASPVSPKELVARVRALLRRRDSDIPPEVPFDFPREISGSGHGRVTFTPTELRLLDCLRASPGLLVDYFQILRRVWCVKKISRNTVHFHMGRLRRKLPAGTIKTIRGVGYCLNQEKP